MGLAAAAPAHASDDDSRGDATDAKAPWLDLPLVDVPFNQPRPDRPAAWPSMQQSLGLSTSAYLALHYGLSLRLDPTADSAAPVTGVLGFALADMLAVYVPPGDAWLHEEFHRAVMSAHGIASHNDVYNLELGAELIAVSHVRDEDLARLKAEAPADMVRLAAAGIEGQNLLVLSLERENFYRQARGYHLFLYWFSHLNSRFYVSSGPDDDTETMTDEMSAEETTVEERDFVGHDFTSWVYDLHRPDEPYAARGPHPSGVGIDRYRAPSDLTEGERRHLRLMGQKQLLNFLDPQLAGATGFRGPPGHLWMASAQHYLTPFGDAVMVHGMTRRETDPDGAGVGAALIHYRNARLPLWGLDVAARRLTTGRSAPWPESLDVRLHAWRQPRRQRYDDTAAGSGGLGSVRARWPLGPAGRWQTYLESEWKSPGWVAGNPWLKTALSGRLGLECRLP